MQPSNLNDILNTDWLCCTDDNGVTYKVNGAEFKELFDDPPVDLEIDIKQVQPVGQDSRRFRATVRFVANVPDLRPYQLEFTPRRYRESEGGPVTDSRPSMYKKQNLVDYTHEASANTDDKEKFTVVVTEGSYEDGKEEWESPQFPKQAFTALEIKRLNISPEAGLYVDGTTITFNEDVWAWGDSSGSESNYLTPLTEEEVSKLHVRYYSALTGQKVVGGEFSGDIRDPANRTLDISSGQLTDAYGNNIEDVTCRIEYKTNITYGTLMGETGWMLPIKPFSWESAG